MHKLPYEKVETFNHNGKTYPTEEAAILAAITDTIDNTGLARIILEKACLLVPLLERQCELQELNCTDPGQAT